MAELTVKLQRSDPNTSWGFRLGGGKDFGYPLAIQRVNPGSLAEQVGVATGDLVLRIQGQSTNDMRHGDAQDVIIRAGNYLELTVAKGGSTTWQPQVAPVGNMPNSPNYQGNLTRTSIAANKQPVQHIGSGHNMSAKPFGSRVPGIIHNPYNSPAPLYSMNNIAEALEKQTEVLTSGAVGINFMKDDKPLNKESAVYKMVQMEEEAKMKGYPSSGGSGGSGGNAIGLRHVEAPKTLPGGDQPSNQTVGGPNTCSECGRLIVGVFVRINNRSMHAECFRCATCGTSLKNMGYTNISGKLYCDIHSGQVASIMTESGPVSPTQRTGSTPSSVTGLVGPKVPTQGPPYSLFQPKVADNKAYGHVSPIGKPAQQPSMQYSPQPQYNTGPAPFSSGYGNPHPVSSGYGAPAPAPYSPGASYGAPQPFSPQQRPVSPRPGGQVMQSSALPFSGPKPSSFDVQPPYAKHQNFSRTTTVGMRTTGSAFGTGSSYAPRRGRGILTPQSGPGTRIPICAGCAIPIRGPFVAAIGKTWCPEHFQCASPSCRRSLQDVGFVEEQGKLYCEMCYEAYLAPVCRKCGSRIKGDCLNALDQTWHPDCFVCSFCKKPFGNNSFYMEDQLPYCEKDWNELFTTKCVGCGYPIEAGDRWVEALSNNYHSQCFKCTICHRNLEGQSFYAKGGRPFCKSHAR